MQDKQFDALIIINDVYSYSVNLNLRSQWPCGIRMGNHWVDSMVPEWLRSQCRFQCIEKNWCMVWKHLGRISHKYFPSISIFLHHFNTQLLTQDLCYYFKNQEGDGDDFEGYQFSIRGCLLRRVLIEAKRTS